MAVVGSSSSAVLFPSSSFNSKLEPGGSVHRGQSSELNIVIDLELKTTPSYTAPSAASIEHSSMSAARGSQKPDSSVSIPWLRVSQDNKPKVHEDTKPVKMEQQKAGGASNDASSVYYDQCILAQLHACFVFEVKWKLHVEHQIISSTCPSMHSSR